MVARVHSGQAPARRRRPVGAEPQAGGVHFRVWAPAASAVSLVLEAADGPLQDIPLGGGPNGYFEALVPAVGVGARYWYRLDGGALRPDPASRFQPDGPHGPSAVVDPSAYAWQDGSWPGVDRTTTVVYEMHVGTFTPAGTWKSAIGELPALAELGITVLEVMPVADFPGEFGWGYDGVNLFAPTRLYGTPDDFRAFVEAAHHHGLGVVLDVVYNHFGPDGCWLEEFSPTYFSDATTEWGRAINFDGEGSGPVREFFLANAACWIEEYHLDGLRLDAVHAIVDQSGSHIVKEIAAVVRQAAGTRSTWVSCENESQQSEMVRSDAEGGLGLDAAWNDDFHHTAIVALTGRREAYYTDYLGSPQEFVSAAKYGFLYQGQHYAWQGKCRGTPSDGVPIDSFVAFLENHDQVANSLTGLRLGALTSPGRLRALTAVLLLGPWTPLLFQGQEFGSTAPFCYFADHRGELARLVREGRRAFLAQFGNLSDLEVVEQVPDPASRDAFERCRLDPAERDRHAATVALHASLLQLRTTREVFRRQGRAGFDGAVLGAGRFVFRYFAHPDGGERADHLLVVNLGSQSHLAVLPEPLLAPPRHAVWSLLWSSEDPQYGGAGTPPILARDGWHLPAEAAIVMAAGAERPR